MGFLAGFAVIIVVHQIPDLLGIAGASGSTVHRLAFTVGHLGQTNGRALGIGVIVLAIVIAAERIDRRLPGALVARPARDRAVDPFEFTLAVTTMLAVAFVGVEQGSQWRLHS